MAKTTYASVDEYIAALPENARPVLETVRRTIQEAVPEAEEVISYGIPAFKQAALKSQGWVFYFSAYKAHYSLSCPPPSGIFDAFKDDLSRYKISKSTIQLPYNEPVPDKLIADMARFRAAENAEKAKTKK